MMKVLKPPLNSLLFRRMKVVMMNNAMTLLIMTDFSMPVQDGPTVTMMIRSYLVEKGVPRE